jgi:hypothetical protein
VKQTPKTKRPSKPYDPLGHSAPQVVAFPPAHSTAFPAAQLVMSQFSVPAVPAGQSTTQCAPAGHVVWHGPLAQVKRQVLSAPHVH